MKKKLKKIVKIILNKDNTNVNNINDDNILILERITNHALPTFLDFSYDKLKTNTLSFVSSMKFGASMYEYKYSSSCKFTNIYSSAYACLIFSMFGKLDELTINEKHEWAEYFNGFQSSKDGLFYDESLRNEIYDNTDWWGARHVVLHLINVYIALDVRPKYPFYFLEIYYDINTLNLFLDEQNWLGKFTHSDDIDNKLMNIAVALQYQRDYWQDSKAGNAVSFIQTYLLSRINPDTGMWGYFNLEDKDELSRMVQFAYHLFPIFFYDSIDIDNKEKIIDFTLKTQNIFGGFGVKLNSSACEDIDSIDILIRFSKLTPHKNLEIKIALKKALIWVLANQNDDGGYVFRRNEPMLYGHEQMNSCKNESAMFPTWFRTLTIACLSNYFFETQFKLVKTPGFLK